MNKRYEANSIVAITVKTGKFNRRVSFMPLSNGKSYYETESKALQKAIEGHSFFKSRMIIETPLAEGSVQDPKSTSVPEEVENAPALETNDENAAELTQIVVAGQSDAVDYLTEKFGISRSKLRSQKAIAEVGKEYGVEFVYS
ncbi:MAG: hypothetical protein J6I61_08630 [Prevotella sp.]|nr:hypothetical protein [Prevotella sp.]